jgi:hypothetical protein
MNWSMSGPHPSGITIWTLDDPSPFNEVTIHTFGLGFTMTLDRHQAPHFTTFEAARAATESTIESIRNPPPKKRRANANADNV